MYKCESRFNCDNCHSIQSSRLATYAGISNKKFKILESFGIAVLEKIVLCSKKIAAIPIS